MLKKISFSLILSIILIILLEIIMRFAFTNQSSLKFFSNDGPAYRKLNWLYYNGGNDFSKSLLRVDKELGWVYKADLKQVDFKGTKLSTNSLGYRNKFDFNSNDSNIIFMLGDSYTFGEEVDDDKNFVSLLNEVNLKWRFYNLGISAYGYDQMYLTMKRYIKSYRPHKIFVAVNFTDFNRAMLSFHDYLKPYFELVDNQLLLHKDHIVEPDELVSNMQYELRLAKLWDIYKWKRYRRSQQYQDDRLKLNLQIFKMMVKEAQKYGAEVIFYFIPIAEQANMMNEEKFQYEKIMFDFCSVNKLQCFSTRGEFRRILKEEKHQFPIKTHWQDKGHQAVFRSIKKFLKMEENNE